jgi:hypothetical protein
VAGVLPCQPPSGCDREFVWCDRELTVRQSLAGRSPARQQWAQVPRMKCTWNASRLGGASQFTPFKLAFDAELFILVILISLDATAKGSLGVVAGQAGPS